MLKVFFSHLLQSSDNPATVADPAKDPKYAEPAIDSLRAQKDEVRERGFQPLVYSNLFSITVTNSLSQLFPGNNPYLANWVSLLLKEISDEMVLLVTNNLIGSQT